MIVLYALLFPIFFTPVILLANLFSPKIRAGFRQKFGKYDFVINEKTLWIHAVSVGEVLAVADFIKNAAAGRKIVLTTSTPQGQTLAQSKLGNFCERICYFPYDYKFAICRAIKAINPAAIMIVETEIWPNFATEAKRAEIPVIIANGRISDATFKSYKRLRPFFARVFENFRVILAQSEDDAKRFVEIGAKPDMVRTMGNIKFDITPPKTKIKEELGKTYNKGDFKVIVAGSTHKGEDEVILKAFSGIEGAKLIIAPRHLERISAIETLLKKTNTRYTLKSKSPDLAATDVILLDTTGELANLYSIADAAILGGSFNNTGGHNPLEATVWGVPVMSGPNVKNFRVIYRELIKNNCAKIVEGRELKDELKKMLQDARKYAENCAQTLEQNRGATRVLEEFIKELYGN